MSSNISIEKLDAVTERVPNATYADAKKALLECDGDVIEAVILLESQKGFGSKTKQAKKTVEQVFSKDNEDLKDLKVQVKELLKKSSVIRVIVEKNGKVVMNIPLTVGVVGLALGPLVTLVGLSAAVIGKYNIMIQNEDDGSIVDLGELNEEKLNMLKQMLTNTAKEVKDVVVDNKKDDKDITDELMKEDESITINLDKKDE
ncbi:hypothetical protein SDC9_139936 [bioreactor metagenome]|uniref:DUF4342 domain-containing protein n=2 Tax=root TaxID=1 RepID=A0A1G9P1N6_9FIRM|nr:DUF4342 domain-containing protein [Romboutsia lituseburensis]CEH33209.1 Domain of unknown function (DUF4342) [Romboutsia lituseburensis]SDL92772.1 protein of unknown function [Romboutsia lituseburensis DSM 797]